jgi:hypothetical protein
VSKTYRREAGGFTGSYFSMRSSASFRFVSFASRIAFIALTYCLKVGDKRLEIGAFSIEMTAFGRSDFVNVKYNATFAPLHISSQLGVRGRCIECPARTTLSLIPWSKMNRSTSPAMSSYE